MTGGPHVAVDLGAASGRVMVGVAGPGRLELHEVHRCARAGHAPAQAVRAITSSRDPRGLTAVRIAREMGAAGRPAPAELTWIRRAVVGRSGPGIGRIPVPSSVA